MLFYDISQLNIFVKIIIVVVVWAVYQALKLLVRKTKEGTLGKTGNISFSNIVASNSETEIDASGNISTSITVGQEEVASDNTTLNITSNNINAIVNGTNKKDNDETLIEDLDPANDYEKVE